MFLTILTVIYDSVSIVVYLKNIFYFYTILNLYRNEIKLVVCFCLMAVFAQSQSLERSVTATSAGLYYFHAQLLWYTTSLPHTFALEIITNDLYQRVSAIAEKSATMNDNPVIGTSALFYLNTGDFVKVVGYEESSGTAVIDNFVGDSHFFGYKIY